MDTKVSLDLSSEMHCVLDPSGKIVEINAIFLKNLQYLKDELIGRDFIDLVAENDLETIQETFDQLAPQPLEQAQDTDIKFSTFNCQLKSKNNNIQQFRGKFAKSEDGYIYVLASIAIMQDAPLARFRRFFDMSLLAIVIITDKEGNLVFANKGFSDTLGYNWQEMTEYPLFHFVYEDDKQATLDYFKELQDNIGVTQEMINRCVCKDGGYKWIDWRAIYVRDHVYAVANDITARKQQEIKIQELLKQTIHTNKELSASRDNLEKTLEELEIRNFELDQFVYKVSHDLRAPLTSILGLVNLSKLDSDNAERLIGYIELIEKSTLKLDKFIKSLLEYSRSGRADIVTEKIDFEAMISDCIEDLKFMKNYERVQRDISLKGNQPFYSEPLRLRIILNNIISNAIKYQNTSVENSFLKVKIDLSTPDTAKLIFQDNGIGIAQEYQGDVFNMFFRGTENAEGSGLGLYIVKQTVEKMHGSISLSSDYGKGTHIILEVPNQYEQFKDKESNNSHADQAKTS
ncbi:PAS domain-containing sensor histidine kinase [uncultured Microscilla sp.]|uniref:PAS domain-containing sensor histidine kinase n=1 Tax=uncultured Microscilla sp. TaxID=432653 RepID=UPI00260B2CEA|nr:PAS domain-containing sensor histidine kinase [uncultured Microscilla sp.]